MYWGGYIEVCRLAHIICRCGLEKNVPFKQILFRLKFSLVSLRRGGPCTNKLIAIGTSTDILPAHGK